jgi:hypothetical protein
MVDSNVRSRGYFVARTHAPCRQCGRASEVFALALPPTHELLDAVSEEGEKTEVTWLSAGVPAFLFFVTWLPDAVQRRLAAYSDAYRLGAGLSPLETCWLNHCEHCGAPQNDEDLHCEPGVFMPGDASEATAIDLVYIDEVFEAAATGYAPDPEFLSWPPTSST